MKLSSVFSTSLILLATTLFAGCGDEEQPLPTPGTFFDSRFDGYWQLVEANGLAVDGYDVNYLYFNGTGQGDYYYYEDSNPYVETLQYQCRPSNNDDSKYQLVIQYENSPSPSYVNYRFSDEANSTLTMSWIENGTPTTYVYTRYPSAPW